jgi:RNA-directed DNA polymerase
MHKVRHLQRRLYRKAKQDKEGKFSSRYDQLWREEGLREAWRHVKATRGAWSVVEIDLQSSVTTIPHDKLLKRIRQRVVDGSMRWLIKQSLKVGVAYPGRIAPTSIGVPQGAPLSPLSSNIYWNLLDQVWHKRGYPAKLGATLHRYADDAILVCRREARQALEALEARARRMDLVVHPDKTRITKRPEGFDCLGLQVVKRRSPTSGKYTISLFPSKTSQRHLRRRSKYCTKRRAPISPDVCVPQINQTVRGWANDYRPTNASQAFRSRQRCLNTRLRRYLTSRSKGRGGGWKRYPNKSLYARGIIHIGSGYIR